MRSHLFWAIICACLPASFISPFSGCVIYSVMNILRPELFFWGSTQTGGKSMQLIIFATMAGILLGYGRFDFKKTFCRRELFLMLWFYLAVLASIYFSNYNIPLAYYYCEELLKIAILCVLISLTVNDLNQVVLFEKVILFAVIFLGVWGIEQHFLGNERLEKLGGYDSNGAAAFFVLFVPLALNKFFNPADAREKLIGGAFALILLLVIVFTCSRGGFLGLIFASFIFIVRRKKPLKTLLSALLIGGVVFLFMSDSYLDRMGTIVASDDEREGSAGSRLILWSAGLMIFQDNFLFGTGYLTFPYAKMDYEYRFSYLDEDFRQWVFRKKSPKVTHNTYIKILSDSGSFAFIPYGLLILTTLIANHRARKRYLNSKENEKTINLLSAIDAGLLGLCLCNVFIDNVAMVFLYVQITICAIMRDKLNHTDRTVGLIENAKEDNG